MEDGEGKRTIVFLMILILGFFNSTFFFIFFTEIILFRIIILGIIGLFLINKKIGVWFFFMSRVLFIFSYGNLFIIFLSLEIFLMVLYFYFFYNQLLNISFILIYICIFIMEGVYGLRIIIKFSRSYGSNYFLIW